MTLESTDAHEWHRIIRASVRECVETWVLQAEGGPVSMEALKIRGRMDVLDKAPAAVGIA